MLEMIQQSVIPHDRYQLELKLDYELGAGKKTHYRISTYIFFPRSLGINENSYPKAEFYRDVKNYIRIKTPEMQLRDMLESDNAPLNAVHDIIRRPNWHADKSANDRIIHALRLFGAMFKSSLREHLILVDKRINESAPNTNINKLVDNLLEEFILQSKNISTYYRAMYTDLNLPSVSEDVFSAYLLVDEYISLLIEESATELFKVVSQHFDGTECKRYQDRLNTIVENETAHRVSHGYGSILKTDDDNETYTFRASVLKKYVSKVLHLSTVSSREGLGIEQALMALAAGISMIFATFVAFYFQRIYGNFTLPVFVALVVGYMFKDRIKEAGRALFAGTLHERLYDRRINIKTLDGQYKLAVLREKITFMQESNLPQEIQSARQKDPFADLDNDRQGETIICHTKDIVLRADLFRKAFGGLPKISGLNDIIRYDIHPYLRKMADPTEKRLLLDDGQLKSIDVHKVYHINFVSKYTSILPKYEKSYKRVRLVLNREGIKHVEHISF